MRPATATRSACSGVTSTVTVRAVLLLLALEVSMISLTAPWMMTRSTATMRRSDRTVSPANRRPAVTPASSIAWVSSMSTWSPGQISPPTPSTASTATLTARVPGVSTAARNPRSPGRSMLADRSSSPSAKLFRSIAPASAARFSAVAVTDSAFMAVVAISVAPRSSARTSAPARSALAAIRTLVRAGGGGGGGMSATTLAVVATTTAGVRVLNHATAPNPARPIASIMKIVTRKNMVTGL